MNWEDRSPATRPSSMTQRSITRVESERTSRLVFGASLAAVVGAFLLAFALAGCTTTAKSEREVINEYHALVRDWPADGPIRAGYKAKVEADAAPYITPSPSPSPTGGAK